MSSSPRSRGTTTTLGLTPFRCALAFEIFANLSALPLTLYSPSTALNIIGSPSPNNPTAILLTQYFGAMISALTMPLILSWPNPETGKTHPIPSNIRHHPLPTRRTIISTTIIALSHSAITVGLAMEPEAARYLIPKKTT